MSTSTDNSSIVAKPDAGAGNRNVTTASRSRIATVAVVVMAGFVPCLLMVRKETEIDLRSGAMRTRYTLGPIPQGTEFQSNDFSRYVREQGFAAAGDKREWYFAHAKGPFAFECGWGGNAANDLHSFMMLADAYATPEPEKAQYARELLALLREREFDELSQLVWRLDDELRERAEAGELAKRW